MFIPAEFHKSLEGLTDEEFAGAVANEPYTNWVQYSTWYYGAFNVAERLDFTAFMEVMANLYWSSIMEAAS